MLLSSLCSHASPFSLATLSPPSCSLSLHSISPVFVLSSASDCHDAPQTKKGEIEVGLTADTPLPRFELRSDGDSQSYYDRVTRRVMRSLPAHYKVVDADGRLQERVEAVLGAALDSLQQERARLVTTDENARGGRRWERCVAPDGSPYYYDHSLQKVLIFSRSAFHLLLCCFELLVISND